MNLYSLVLIRSEGRDIGPALEEIAADGHALIRPAQPWAMFRGLFGIGSNEAFLMFSGDRETLAQADQRLAATPALTIGQSHTFEPTVRPVRPDPLTSPGLYVLRFFDVDNSNIDEIAALSNEAWSSFVDTSDYQTDPKALFCDADRRPGPGKMMLVTWYDGFDSWQASRTPAPAAADNFRRRRQLTSGTKAYATSLVIDP